MNKFAAFVGHSFLEEDMSVVAKFLHMFNKVKDMGIGFTWDHAEAAEIKVLSEKVKEKMKGKNLFIGICTKRDYAVSPRSIKKMFLNKSSYKVQEDALEWKTTEWIIQEIGFAIGKDMNIILIVEEGLHRLGGLQGDMEYISFSRSEPEKSFPKLLEMLTSLMPKKIGTEETLKLKDVDGQTETGKEIAEKEAASIKVKDDVGIPREDWSDADYENAIVGSIFAKEKEKDKELYDAYILSDVGKDTMKRVEFDASRLYLQQLFLKYENLEKLKLLQKEHPTNIDVYHNMGRVYEIYEEYDKAADCYIKAASYSEDIPRKSLYLSSAAIAFADHGDYEKAYKIMEEVKIIIPEHEEAEIDILMNLAIIAKKKNDAGNYLALMEGYLEHKVDNHAQRFNIAYKYSEEEDSNLALYHYKILSKRNPGDGVWNNLGVAYDHFGLNYSSVKAYRESEKYGSTIAISNLADKFIKAGFLDEAKEICDGAVKKKDYDERVAGKISKIKEVITQEDEKENNIIDNTKKRREFYSKYAKQYIKRKTPDFTGSWQGPKCDLNVVIKNSLFEAIGSYEKKDEGLASMFGIQKSGILQARAKKIDVKYTGSIYGYAIRYTVEENEEGKINTLLSVPMSKKGLMILSDDLTCIEVCEKSEKDKYTYYSLEKKK